MDELKNKIFEVRDAIETKTNKFIEEQSIVESVVGVERQSLDLLRDKLAQIKGYVEELYKHIGNLGKIDFSGSVKIEGLSTLLSSLKDDKLSNKLTAMYVYLDDFAKAVNQIDFKNNLTQELNAILSKGEELKSLASILKSSSKKIKNAGKGQESKDLKEYESAYKDLISTEERYQELTNKQNSGIILSAKEAKELVKIENTRSLAQERINELIKKTSGEIQKQSNVSQDYANHQKVITEAIKAAADAQEKLDAESKANSLKNDLQKEIDYLDGIKNASKYTKEFREEIKRFLGDAQKAFNGTDADIENMINSIKNFRKEISKQNLASSLTVIKKEKLDISDILSKNTKMSKELKTELMDLYKRLEIFENTHLFSDEELTEIKNRIIDIKAEIKNTGQAGKSAATKLKEQIPNIKLCFVGSGENEPEIKLYSKNC